MLGERVESVALEALLFPGIYGCSALQSAIADEFQDVRQFTDVEPSAMFRADVDHDAADLAKITTQHQITANGAVDVLERFPDWIAGAVLAGSVASYVFEAMHHGV